MPTIDPARTGPALSADRASPRHLDNDLAGTLLALSDTLRALDDPAAIQGEAARLAGERLGTARAFYAEHRDGSIRIDRDHARGLPSLVGSHPANTLGRGPLDYYARGEAIAVAHSAADPRLDAADRAHLGASGVVACAGAGVVENGELVASFTVQDRKRRDWTAAELTLVREVAERTRDAVARARDATAIRASEARFRQFGDHSADTLWIMDAAAGRLEYLNLAFDTMFGEPRATVMADLSRWRALVHPEDRAFAGATLPRAMAGEAVTIEYRIVRPFDGSVRWVRDSGFPLRGEDGRVQRVAGIVQDITERKRAEDQQRLLLAELQHRVRIMLGAIRSIARRTADSSATVEDYRTHFEGRLAAFARAQNRLVRDPGRAVDLEAIVADELLAQHARPGERATYAGPEVRLTSRMADQLGLALHELATNAVKYGALGKPDGHLTVRWRVDRADAGKVLHFEWIEHVPGHGVMPPAHGGFGTDLLRHGLADDLDAIVDLDFQPQGLRCVVDVPLGARG